MGKRIDKRRNIEGKIFVILSPPLTDTAAELSRTEKPVNSITKIGNLSF